MSVLLEQYECETEKTRSSETVSLLQLKNIAKDILPIKSSFRKIMSGLPDDMEYNEAASKIVVLLQVLQQERDLDGGSS